MARPHLELGTHGRIRVYPDPAGYRAVCLYRDWDGVTRQVQRQAKSKGAAERALEHKHPKPNGYASYLNGGGQTIDPFTGQTVGKSSPWWHWEFLP